MDIGTILQTLIGTVVGGGIVIATNWINAQREKKEAVKQWYENTYINQGIDPIITYLTDVEYRLLVGGSKLRTVQTDLTTVPLDALTRIQTLLDSQVLTKFIGLVQIIPATYGKEAVLLVAISNMGQELIVLRKVLLKVISTKVNNKNYVIDASETSKKLNVIYDELYSFGKQSGL